MNNNTIMEENKEPASFICSYLHLSPFLGLVNSVVVIKCVTSFF